MNFGENTSEQDSSSIMSEALDQNINFFDTADVSAASETESIIGRWFAQDSSRREKIVNASNIYGGQDPWPNKTRLSARHIVEACNASLKRLRTDHRPLPNAPYQS